VLLPSTDGKMVDLGTLPGVNVVYAFPRTGRPEEADSAEWDSTPGARGCTPQSCAFRDHYATFKGLDASVFGLSTQTTSYQREAVARLALPFPLLSDADLSFTSALRLPTYDFEPYPGESPLHLRRLTIVVDSGTIRAVFYPVFPPHLNAAEVVGWLRSMYSR
jgi:peroxiredoxin